MHAKLDSLTVQIGKIDKGMRKLQSALDGRTLNPSFLWDADADGKVTHTELTQLEADIELNGTLLVSSMRTRLNNAGGELGWPNLLAAPLDPNQDDNVRAEIKPMVLTSTKDHLLPS